jgi:hypothetical protein
MSAKTAPSVAASGPDRTYYEAAKNAVDTNVLSALQVRRRNRAVEVWAIAIP